MSLTKSNKVSVRPTRGDKNSPVHELMGIADQRKSEIEDVIFCSDTSSFPKSNLEVLTSIKESVKTTREFAYAMYVWGSLQNTPPAKESDDDEGDSIDNP